MIISENPRPTLSEFKELMRNIDIALNHSASSNASYFLTRGGTNLEKDVRDAAIECARNTKFEGSIQLVSGATFPDIVAAKFYGIEVKSTTSNHWKTIGNSILETTRVSDVERLFLTFGKLSNPVGFISRPYEECLSGIAVTHYPRYQIDMSLDKGDTIFDKMGVTYDELRTKNNPVTSVAQYYKSQLKQGESLWWAGERVEAVVPVTVKLWKSLSAYEKDELEAMVYVYFPETILSRGPHKYDRATLWLATQKGIINANVRDSFSAGGRSIMPTIDGRYVNMPAIFRKIAEHIELIAGILTSEPSGILYENWMVNVSPNRVKQWINLVISETSDLNLRKDAKAVLEQIFYDYGLI